MSEEGRPEPPRAHRAFQPIEPVDESRPPTAAPDLAGLWRAARPRPQPEREIARSGETRAEPGHLPPDAPIALAARFTAAASALVFAGQMLAIGRADGLGYRHGPDRSWWVTAELPLDLARELVEAARGGLYADDGAGLLLPDRGWGDPPERSSLPPGTAAQPADQLAPVDVVELVRVAGLHDVRERAHAAVSVILPGRLMPPVVRRAMDLNLLVGHRPVRLLPLFAPERPGTDGVDPILIELQISAAEGHVPRSLLTALAREPHLTVCRRGGTEGNLLIEYGVSSPLLDHLLAGLCGERRWLLTRGALGCRVLEPAGADTRFVDSAAHLLLDDGFALESDAEIVPDGEVRLPAIGLVRARTPGRQTDALLLADADLEAVCLLLEGHPLAESAVLVGGREHHLLLAPGGLLERLPLGESLYNWGPGQLYLPLGFTCTPDIPPSARRPLFRVDDGTAVVLTDRRLTRFNLEHRRPLWNLWLGQEIALEFDLPEDSLAELRDVDEQATSAPPVLADPAAGLPRQAKPTPDDQRTEGSIIGAVLRWNRNRAKNRDPAQQRGWQEIALDAELTGNLVKAAELHEQHGDRLRAARLYERAALDEAQS